MDGVLGAIRFARESSLPLLGTCGGFQHIVLEYARNVLGFADAAHAEYDPYASKLFISQAACSLVGRELVVSLRPESLVVRAYGTTITSERYYCNFVVNSEYNSALAASDLAVVGSDFRRSDPGCRVTQPSLFCGYSFCASAPFANRNSAPISCKFPKCIALLLSEKLTAEQRRAIGWTLVAVGALTTIPLVLQLFSEDE
jgi:hypothetical protein